jgi:hypothetical protein
VTETMRVNQRRQAKQRPSTWDYLEKLDRYECRVPSRRNKAIKAFDEVCAAQRMGRPRCPLTPPISGHPSQGPRPDRLSFKRDEKFAFLWGWSVRCKAKP